MLKSKFSSTALNVLALFAVGACVYANPAQTVQNPGANPPPPTAVAPQPDQTPNPNPPSEAPSAEPAQAPGVNLQLKFTKGEVFVYRISTETTGMMSRAGGSIPMDSSTSMVMVETVKGVRPDGAARLAMVPRDITMSVQGRAFPVTSKLKAMMAGSSEVIDTHGNIEGMNMGSANPMAGMMTAPGTSLSSYALPSGPVRIGDIWTRPMSMPALGMNATTTYFLQNTWMSNGKLFAAIHSSASGNFSMQPSAQGGMSMNMSGPLNMTSDIILDNTGGVVRQVKGSVHMQLTMTMSMPTAQGGAGTPQTMVNDTTVTTTMQLVKVERP